MSELNRSVVDQFFPNEFSEEALDRPRECHVCGCKNYKDRIADDGCFQGLNTWVVRDFYCGQSVSYEYRDPMIVDFCSAHVPKEKITPRRWWF